MSDPNDFQLDTSPFTLDQGTFSLDDAPPPEVPDPLANVPWTGDAEPDSLAEMETLKDTFVSSSIAKFKSGFNLATDTEYWCCLCFPTRAQKEAFLAAMKWLELGDKYLDGTVLAQRQGIDLPPLEGSPILLPRTEKALSELSLPLE